MRESENESSIFKLVDRWLGRTPFLDFRGFNFWIHYRKAVEDMLESDRKSILAGSLSSEEEKQQQLAEVTANEENFNALLDEEKHNQLIATRKRRLSHKATQAALLIELYRDEPILHIPFRLLTVLKDIDENFTTWRYRHALLAQRMLGTKIGTGGSSGHQYLKRAADNNRVFIDLFNLSTYLIPRSRLPKLPPTVLKQLHFQS